MVLRKPGPLVAWFDRTPSYLFRAHLGALAGPRLVMLTTLGRRSGLVRRTVVEVFAIGPTPEGTGLPVIQVVASRGTHSDWYANALAMGRIRVDWMSRRGRADVHRLGLDERVELLGDYARRHRRAAAMLAKGVLDEPFTGEPAQLRRLASEVRALRLVPASPTGASVGATLGTDVAPPR